MNINKYIIFIVVVLLINGALAACNGSAKFKYNDVKAIGLKGQVKKYAREQYAKNILKDANGSWAFNSATLENKNVCEYDRDGFISKHKKYIINDKGLGAYERLMEYKYDFSDGKPVAKHVIVKSTSNGFEKNYNIRWINDKMFIVDEVDDTKYKITDTLNESYNIIHETNEITNEHGAKEIDEEDLQFSKDGELIKKVVIIYGIKTVSFYKHNKFDNYGNPIETIIVDSNTNETINVIKRIFEYY
jgi:hypothetical protein